MPVLPLDRLPVPNLKIYSVISVAALSTCVYFAAQVIRDPNWNNAGADMDTKGIDLRSAENRTILDNRTLAQYVSDIFSVMIREPVRVWAILECCDEYVAHMRYRILHLMNRRLYLLYNHSVGNNSLGLEKRFCINQQLYEYQNF